MNRQVLAVSVVVLTATMLVLIGSSMESTDLSPQTGNAVIIPLSGTITPQASSGLGTTAAITPESVRELNKKALKKDPEAIIYEINSGGGAVVASKEVKREIESINVTTVCRFRDISASGAYLLSLGCDRIVADSASLTGSIGVRSSYLQYNGLMDRFGVKYINISSGKYKEVGSPYSNVTETEKEILLNKTQKIHEEFIEMVAEERNLTESQIETVRTGEPFLGERAKKLGLVDKLGGRQTAVTVAESLTDKKLETKVLETGPGFSLSSLFFGSLGIENKAPLRAEY